MVTVNKRSENSLTISDLNGLEYFWANLRVWSLTELKRSKTKPAGYEGSEKLGTGYKGYENEFKGYEK